MDEDINKYRKAWQDAPEGASTWEYWGPLRQALRERYDVTHNVSDLSEIIREDLRLLVLRVVPLNGSNIVIYAHRMALIGGCFEDRRARTLNEKDTAKALYFRKLALAICPVEATRLKAVVEEQLAFSMLRRAEEKGSMKMMNIACAHAEHAMAVAQAINDVAGIRHSHRLGTLANILRQRYSWTGAEIDLNRSIELFEKQAVEDEVLDDPTLCFQNLGLSLHLRYQLRGNIADLNRAIIFTQRSLQAPRDAELHADRAQNFSGLLEEKFKRSGNIDNLRTAAKVLWDARQNLAYDSARRANLCQHACRIVRGLYRITNHTLDLEEAFAVAHEGLACRHITESIRYKLVHELGLTFLARSERYKSMEDAKASLDLLEEAQRSAPNSVNSGTIAGNIANVYSEMYNITREITYLVKAKDKFLETLELLDNNDSLWISLNLAGKFLKLYLKDKRQDSNRTQNLSEAMKHIGRCLEARRIWDGGQWAQTCLLGGTLHDQRYEVTQDAEDFSSALTLFLECWKSTSSPLLPRLKAVRAASDLLVRVSRWADAWELLQAATSLFPAYCRPDLRRSDQQHAAAELSGIAASACAAGLMVGDVEKALEILEQGRGLMVASAHAAIGDLSDLKSKHEHLYRSFQGLRESIFQSESKIHSYDDGDVEAYGQGRPNTETSLKLLDALLRLIRSQPGFGTFLLPITSDQMRVMAGDGAIVVLNHTFVVSHAILVTKDSIRALQLQPISGFPNINVMFGVVAATSLEKLTRKESTRNLDQSEKNDSITNILSVLWTWVAGPVCENLGFTRRHWEEGSKEGRRGKFRIWWMPTGYFTRVPIHAAGIWLGDCTDTVPKRAISSYTASFRMLAFARSCSQNLEKAESRGLFVSMARPDPKVSYHKKRIFLTSADREADLVRSVNGKIGWDDLTRPSAQDLLDALPDYPYLHVAAHGISDPNDPSASRLILMKKFQADGTDPIQSVKPDRLMVQDISRRRSEKAVLAFLAACCTAEQKVQALADEGLQIANAFQLAGFPHVVATLWPADDSICPGFAESFYRFLGRWIEHEPLNNNLIAAAANLASMTLIRDNLHQPRLWACFIHIGP